MGTANTSEVTTTTSVNPSVLAAARKAESSRKTSRKLSSVQAPPAIRPSSRNATWTTTANKQGDDDKRPQGHANEGWRAHPQSPPTHSATGEPIRCRQSIQWRVSTTCYRKSMAASLEKRNLPATRGSTVNWCSVYSIS